MGPELAAIITLVLYAPALLLLALWGQRDLAQKRRSLEIDSLLPAFKTAARRLGFRTARDRRLRGARIEGTIGSSRITAECAARGLGPWLTTIRTQPQPPLPDEVWLQSHWHSRASANANDVASSQPGIDTGDTAFDAPVSVGGRTAVARVLLTEPARRPVSALARRGVVSLRGGSFVHETIERIWDADQLIALVHEVLAAQAAMPRVTDVLTTLADAARTDPAPGVRARCLTTLFVEQADQSRIAIALDLALSDESDTVRVVAATALGERGVPVLREIAKREDARLNALIHGDAIDPELASAARQAIAAIQSRLPGASPGQVSLAEGEAGHVSLASDDRAGQVSLSPAEKQAP